MGAALGALLLASAFWGSTPPGHVKANIKLKAMPAKHALTLYERVLGPRAGASIRADAKGKALLMEDSKTRIERMRVLIASLDSTKKGLGKIYVRPVMHRQASDMRDLLKRILGKRIGREVKLAADDPSSHLVLMCSAAEYRTLDRLIRRLDVTPRDEQRIFVLPGKSALPLPGQ